MDIQVKDEQRALASCTNGKNHQKKLNDAINSLESLINKVKTTWESTGADKETYILELEKQISNLRVIGDSGMKFFNTIQSYITQIQQLRARTVGDGGGSTGGARFTSEDLERVAQEDREKMARDAAANREWIENAKKEV